jgi:hypothetical protein
MESSCHSLLEAVPSSEFKRPCPNYNASDRHGFEGAVLLIAVNHRPLRWGATLQGPERKRFVLSVI